MASGYSRSGRYRLRTIARGALVVVSTLLLAALWLAGATALSFWTALQGLSAFLVLIVTALLTAVRS